MFSEMRKALFWAKVQKSENSGCWLWIASCDSKGYGQFGFMYDGKRINLRAHRIAYELVRGPIPSGMSLHHNCEVKNCVNPAHLVVCTHQQNMTTGKWGRKQKPRCAQYQLEKTHCPKGHPLSGDNLYIYPDGRRQCETCRQAAREDYAARVPPAKWSDLSVEKKAQKIARRRQWRWEQRAKGIKPS